MLEALFEILVQIVLEAILGFVGEMLSELGLTYFDRAANRLQNNPIVAGLGYVMLGLVLGLLSYPIFPNHLIQYDAIRLAYGILSPIFLGLMLCFVSWVINRRSAGEPIFRWDKFIFGAVLGIVYSATRYWTMNW